MTFFDALQKYPLSTALKGVGWSLSTYRAARRDPDFAKACDAAMASRETRLLDVIEMATVEDHKAAQWLLERTAGADFREVREVETRVQVEVERLLDKVQPLMSDNAYGELISAIETIAGVREVKVLPSGSEEKT